MKICVSPVFFQRRPVRNAYEVVSPESVGVFNGPSGYLLPARILLAI